MVGTNNMYVEDPNNDVTSDVSMMSAMAVENITTVVFFINCGIRRLWLLLLSVSTGVMKPLLAKLSKLQGEEYVKLKGVRKQIKFLRDELSIMNTTFQMLADQEELSPQMRDWRDRVQELAYDMEDCIDAFMVHVDDKQHDGHTVFKGLLHKLKILKASHKIANTIEDSCYRVK
jgi:hypothetical protein